VKVRVRLFAVAREAAGNDSVELELPEQATIALLRRRLVQRVPRLAALAGRLVFAVDREYADDAMKIPPGADVACIPPVSGG